MDYAFFCVLSNFFFFFKQKTAYEMRISDWSSDVCSSDLPCRQVDQPQHAPAEDRLEQRGGAARREIAAERPQSADEYQAPDPMPARHHLGKQRIGDGQHPARGGTHHEANADVQGAAGHRAAEDRKDVGLGKRVSLRGDLRGGGYIKKKT